MLINTSENYYRLLPYAILSRRLSLDYTKKLENVVIANALQLEAARRRCNFVAHAKFEVAQPFRCRLIAFSLLI